jgi:hypothetical protein
LVPYQRADDQLAEHHLVVVHYQHVGYVNIPIATNTSCERSDDMVYIVPMTMFRRVVRDRLHILLRNFLLVGVVLVLVEK